jgi:hypothetical protein
LQWSLQSQNLLRHKGCHDPEGSSSVCKKRDFISNGSVHHQIPKFQGLLKQQKG